MGKYEEQDGNMSSEVLKGAIAETERLFVEHVRDNFGRMPTFASVGSSCLIGVIKGDDLYVGNIGDSRAVKGVLGKPNKMLRALMGNYSKIRAEQITNDHNVNIEDVRREVRDEHPNDPNILVRTEGIWFVKETTQLSRSLGHASLKHPELAYGPELNNKHITGPVIRSDPDVFNGKLSQSDQFIIFASHGFWERMTNEEAVDIVYRHPHAGIARRLVIKAMKKAVRKNETGHGEWKKTTESITHNDMTVAVIFIDYEWLKRESPVYPVSIKGPLSPGPNEPGSSRVVSPGAEQSSFRRREGKQPRDPAADRIEMLTDRRRKNSGPVIK